jgi:hypothetical protein
MVRCLVLGKFIRMVPGVWHVCLQPVAYAGACVLGYVREHESVLVAYYHVCI